METETNFEHQARPPQRVPLERLAMLYEGIFTVIVRVQSGKQPVQKIDAFRSRMRSVLDDITRAGTQRGYSDEDLAQANFAVVAFLDEAVLTASDSGRTEWARKTLQEELFNQRSAGELFFQKLDRLRAHRDSPELLQVLEVFYLCLLLGYEGKFSVGSKAELYLLMDNLRERLERGFGRSVSLSPDAQIDVVKPQTVAAPDLLPDWSRWFAIAAAVLVVLCFFACKLYLDAQAGNLDALIAAGKQ